MKHLRLFKTNADYESATLELPNVSYVEETGSVFCKPFIDYSKDYLTIEALEDGLTAKLSVNACEYCVDGDGNWTSLAADTDTISINTGQTLSFRGKLTPVYDGIGTFTISKKCNLKGNCMSMLYGDNAADNNSVLSYSFANLFNGATNIVSVSSSFLPAINLDDNCYRSMFEGCTSLTTAPELPATVLSTNCYICMFKGCTSLTKAPELPATVLTMFCYQHMFNGCTSLTTAPELPALIVDQPYCYSSMFNGCSNLNYIKMLATNVNGYDSLFDWVKNVSSTGTFVKHPDMTSLPTGASGIPEGWTIVDYKE